MIEIHADELQAGDVIEWAGERHRIAGVERRPGWAWSIASDDRGWAIALDHQVVAVQRFPLAA